MFNKLLPCIVACAIGFIAMVTHGAQAAPAGNIIFVSGDAQIIRAGGQAPNVTMAAKNTVVNEGDTLLSGGFRTITGVIGRRSNENYRVSTPTATIGIRGTDHEPHYIAPPAPGAAALGEPGTYNKVNVGATFIRNDSGTVELGPNQTGFASAIPGKAPVRLSVLPGFMRNAPAPLGTPDRSGAVEDESGSRRQAFISKLADWADGDQERKQLAHILLRYAVRVAGSGLDLSNPAGGAFSLAQPGTALVAGFTTNNLVENGGLVITQGNGNLILLGPNNHPLFIATADDGLRYSRDTAPLFDTGEGGIRGTNVNWGIYAGGSLFFKGSDARTPQFFYFMGTGNVSSQADLALTTGPMGATFNTVVGFTKPINEAGQLGGNVNLSVSVTFGAAPQLTAYNLGVQDAGGRNWNASLNAPSVSLASFAGGGGGPPNLNVSCGACPGPKSGNATGYVVGGANRDGLISSYKLSAGSASVTGAVAVK